jgi:hypothetical protein
MVRELVNRTQAARAKRAGQNAAEDGDASSGSLFSSGLVAGGALSGLALMALSVSDSDGFQATRNWLSSLGPKLLGPLSESPIFALVTCALVAASIYFIGIKPSKELKK